MTRKRSLEGQSLQTRSYFSFIAAIVGLGLMEVFASQDPATLQQVLVSLVQELSSIRI